METAGCQENPIRRSDLEVRLKSSRTPSDIAGEEDTEVVRAQDFAGHHRLRNSSYQFSTTTIPLEGSSRERRTTRNRPSGATLISGSSKAPGSPSSSICAAVKSGLGVEKCMD